MPWKWHFWKTGEPITANKMNRIEEMVGESKYIVTLTGTTDPNSAIYNPSVEISSNLSDLENAFNDGKDIVLKYVYNSERYYLQPIIFYRDTEDGTKKHVYRVDGKYITQYDAPYDTGTRIKFVISDQMIFSPNEIVQLSDGSYIYISHYEF